MLSKDENVFDKKKKREPKEKRKLHYNKTKQNNTNLIQNYFHFHPKEE